ncbi:MAG: glyceraldehyde-3-phosphate dehydrogenase [Alphaproteobacteria bacterium]|nr:glyceraldehyde-3-phosphate dehydrogenase [Alphaproteobacteria bacterium]MDA7983355.1 glyceraldehyde-3-phosphate dehydrogenase [Alphaproteobacteria bacterium]MDA8030808.1 glyceraldehyde-3-phosphate dehydrogenase [Alphaproteobacteria bacterium]
MATKKAPPLRLAVNGFGRIGRLVARAVLEDKKRGLRLVAINSNAPPETLAHLLQYDSVHGRFPGVVAADGDALRVGRHRIEVFSRRNPRDIDWRRPGAEIVLECSGVHKTRASLGAHLAGGARRVLVSSPAAGAERTVVYGVNHGDIKRSERVISCASCTTNCLAPLLVVLERNFGIERAFASAVHAYTSDQRLVDGSHRDSRRARAAGLSIIPTSSGLAEAVFRALPEFRGRLDGSAVRVPVANVSFLEVTATLARAVDADEVNGVFVRASRSAGMRGILSVSEVPLVSADFNHDSRSAVVDLHSTRVVDGCLVRVAAWYDNEWGFANRMVDLAVYLGRG